MAYPKETREKAVAMRKQGQSLKEIARCLGIAKSTASLWLGETELSPGAVRGLRCKEVAGRSRGRAVMVSMRRQSAMQNQAEAERVVNRTLADFHGRDPWRLLAAMLFWCEGGKRRLSALEFINSDPLMMGTYLTALRRGFSLDETRFRVRLHLHEYHDVREQALMWSHATRIPTPQFQKPYLKPNTGKNKRLGYPGCANVRYADARLAKTLDAIYHAFAVKVMGA
jgi:transposase-like protein